MIVFIYGLDSFQLEFSKVFGRDFLIYRCNGSYSQALLFCDLTLNLPLIASPLLDLWLVLSLPGLHYLDTVCLR